MKTIRNITLKLYKPMVKTLLCLTLVFNSLYSTAQNLLSYDELQNKKVYSSVEDIKANLDSVYRTDVTFWTDDDLKILMKIPNLQHLQINDPGIPADNSIGIDYGKLSQLQILEMHVEQDQFPPSILNLKHLTHLHLSGLENFPDNLDWFKKLEVLEPLVHSSEQVRVWKALKDDVKIKLPDFYATNCYSNQPWNGYFSSFDMANEYKDEVIRFRVCGKTDLKRVSELKKYPNLKLLVIFGEDLETIPQEIYELNNLEELRIYNCKLKNIPTGISKMTSIKKLNLSTNDFESLPKDFYNLPNIEEVYFEQCTKLTHVSDDIKKLEKLRVLVFGIPTGSDTNGGTDTTPLTEIPSGVYKLQKLEYLGLSCTNIVVFPKDLQKLKSLKKLTINFYLEAASSQLKSIRKMLPNVRVF